MARYLVSVRNLLGHFVSVTLEHIPRSENNHVDALSRLASAYDTDVSRNVPVKLLPASSIAKEEEEVMEVEPSHTWMTLLIAYFGNHSVVQEVLEA